MLGKFIHRHNALILLITFLISLGSVLLFPRLRTDTDFRQFFSRQESAFLRYQLFTQKLGSHDNLLVIALHHTPSVFDAFFLQRLQQLQARIDSMPGVQRTSSLLSLKKYRQTLPGMVDQRPYVQAAHPERFAKDSVLIFSDYPLTQHFINRNAQWTKMLVQVNDQISLQGTDSLVQRIDTAVAGLSLGPGHLMGRKYMESEFKKLVDRELKTSLLLSLSFVVLILFLLHRSLGGVVVPVLCMSVSLIMLYGYMALFHRPLTVLSSLFPTIILVVGISDVIHISSKFAFESLGHNAPAAAVTKTLKEIGLTTFINSLTTALGFLSLLTMSMEALRNFGVDAAVGLLIAWVNSVFLLPALLLRFKLGPSFRKPVASPYWHWMLEKIYATTKAYPQGILIGFTGVLCLAVVGLVRINTNNYVLTSLPQNNRLRNDYLFFDRHLGGGRTFELVIQTKNGHHLYEQPIIRDIDQLEQYLEKEHGVSEIVSPVLAVKWLHTTLDRNAAWKLPRSEEAYGSVASLVASGNNRLPVVLSDSTATTGRLYGRMADKGRKTLERSYDSMHAWINTHMDTANVRLELTGSDYITDRGHQLRIDNMKQSFVLEIAIVSLVVGIIYHSGILVLISFLANIVPIVLIGGIMGFAGIELRGATTAIFAVGYVIAVDDTLHILNRFKLEKKKGLSTEEALHTSVLHTGRAVIITSLILLGGFLVLLHSSFGDVFMHGFMISLIVLTGLITELLLTPVLVRLFFPDRARQEGAGHTVVGSSKTVGHL